MKRHCTDPHCDLCAWKEATYASPSPQGTADPAEPAYDFEHEADRIIEALDLKGAKMTLLCALHEAYDAGRAAHATHQAVLRNLLRRVLEWRALDGDGISDPLRSDVARLLGAEPGETK